MRRPFHLRFWYCESLTMAGFIVIPAKLGRKWGMETVSFSCVRRILVIWVLSGSEWVRSFFLYPREWGAERDFCRGKGISIRRLTKTLFLSYQEDLYRASATCRTYNGNGRCNWWRADLHPVSFNRRARRRDGRYNSRDLAWRAHHA